MASEVPLKLALSIAAVAGCVFALQHAPRVRIEGGENTPAVIEPQKRLAEHVGSPDAAADFRIEGLPFRIERLPVADCSASTFDPKAEGHCADGCTWLSRQHTADTAAFLWLEEPASKQVHGMHLDCTEGVLSHFVTSIESAVHELGRATANPALRARTVPLVPGAVEVISFSSGNVTVFFDRPYRPHTALEELQLELFSRGWRLAGGPRLAAEPDAPETRVLVRGQELCVATLHEEPRDVLLVSAYSHAQPPPEDLQ